MPEYPEKLQTLLDVFAGVTDTHERTQLLLDYAKRFKEVPAEVATRPFGKDHLVPHCESEAYVWAVPNADGTLALHFAVENPSGVSAKALGAILQKTLSGLPAGRGRHGSTRRSSSGCSGRTSPWARAWASCRWWRRCRRWPGASWPDQFFRPSRDRCSQ